MDIVTQDETKGKDAKLEAWKPVVGYEGIYEVSNSGRVRSLDRKDSAGRPRLGKNLSPGICKGYPFVQLCRDGKPSLKRIHMLVAAAFLGERPEGHEINHIDGDKKNNRPENLEYVSHLKNMQHAAELGQLGKLSVAQVQQLREMFTNNPKANAQSVARQIGINVSSLYELLNAKTYKGIANKDGTPAQRIARSSKISAKEVIALKSQGMSTSEIAKQSGLTIWGIYAILYRAGLQKKRQKQTNG